MMLKTIKAVEAGRRDPVLFKVGPRVLSGTCVHPSPHVHQAMGVDQLLQVGGDCLVLLQLLEQLLGLLCGLTVLR